MQTDKGSQTYDIADEMERIRTLGFDVCFPLTYILGYCKTRRVSYKRKQEQSETKRSLHSTYSGNKKSSGT